MLRISLGKNNKEGKGENLLKEIRKGKDYTRKKNKNPDIKRNLHDRHSL